MIEKAFSGDKTDPQNIMEANVLHILYGYQ
jgi:hypothetical protein